MSQRRPLLFLLCIGEQNSTSFQNQALVSLSDIQLGDKKSSFFETATLCRCSPVLFVGVKTPGLRIMTLGKSLQEFVRRIPHKAETGEALAKQRPGSSLRKGRLSLQQHGWLQTPREACQITPTASPALQRFGWKVDAGPWKEGKGCSLGVQAGSSGDVQKPPGIAFKTLCTLHKNIPPPHPLLLWERTHI